MFERVGGERAEASVHLRLVIVVLNALQSCSSGIVRKTERIDAMKRAAGEVRRVGKRRGSENYFPSLLASTDY